MKDSQTNCVGQKYFYTEVMVSTQYIIFNTTPNIIMYVIKNMKNHINPLQPSDTIKSLREKNTILQTTMQPMKKKA